MKGDFPAGLAHVRGKRGCGFMLVSLKSGRILRFGLGKTCRPLRYIVGAPTRCDKCERRIHLQPMRNGQFLGIRCFDCCKVFCYRCVRGHFRLKFHKDIVGALKK